MSWWPFSPQSFPLDHSLLTGKTWESFFRVLESTLQMESANEQFQCNVFKKRKSTKTLKTS